MQNLSYEDFLRIIVPVPDDSEQGGIVASMSREFGAVQELQGDVDRAIALAQERRAALITAAVTGQIDVTGRRRGPSDAEKLEGELAGSR